MLTARRPSRLLHASIPVFTVTAVQDSNGVARRSLGELNHIVLCSLSDGNYSCFHGSDVCLHAHHRVRKKLYDLGGPKMFF